MLFRFISTKIENFNRETPLHFNDVVQKPTSYMTSTNYQGDQLSRGNNMKISQLHFNVLHFKCNFVQHLNFCVQDTFARATQSA